MTTDLTRTFKETVKARADRDPAFRAELWASLVIEERFLKRQWLKMREMLQSWKKLLADDTNQTQAKSESWRSFAPGSNHSSSGVEPRACGNSGTNTGNPKHKF